MKNCSGQFSLFLFLLSFIFFLHCLANTEYTDGDISCVYNSIVSGIKLHPLVHPRSYDKRNTFAGFFHSYPVTVFFCAVFDY